MAKTLLDILRDLKSKKRMTPMAQQDIQAAEIPASDLFFFKIEDKEVGPYYKFHIKEYLEEFKDVASSCYLRGYQEQQYTLLYEHKDFSRREQSSHIQVDNYKQARYLYLNKGQKKGPIAFPELEEQVKATKILRTDQISLDAGKTWIKVYQLPCFDRRSPENRKKVNLPYMPSSATFADEGTSKKHPKQVEQALVDLAILGHVGVAKDKVVEPLPSIESPSQTGNTSLTKWVAGFCFVLAVAAGWIFSGEISPLVEKKNTTRKSQLKAEKTTKNSSAETYKLGTPKNVSTQKPVRKPSQVRKYRPKRSPSSARRKPQIRRKFPTDQQDDRPVYDEPEEDLYKDEERDDYADAEPQEEAPQKKAVSKKKEKDPYEEDDYYDDEPEESARDIAADEEEDYREEEDYERLPEDETFDEEVDY